MTVLNVDPSRRLHVALVCYGLVLVVPMLLLVDPASTHDGSLHQAWARAFSAQFWSGDLYPRWLVSLNSGLGSPAFFFYPPVPCYTIAILDPLVVDSGAKWREFVLSAAVALISSGWFAFWWLKQLLSSRSAAWAGAAAYMAAPYHLIDWYSRGAFAEFWAFVWMPLLLGLVNKYRENGLAGVGLSLTFALLIMTHPPTTLIFVPVVVAYVVSITQTHKLRVLTKVIGWMFLGLMLSSVYLLPALAMQQFVSMQKMREGILHYSYGLFFPGIFSGQLNVANTTFYETVFVVVLVTTTLGVLSIVFITLSNPNVESARQMKFWASIAAYALFMMLPIATPIYELIWPMKLIQFPWRFGGLLTLSVALLFGLAVSAQPTYRSSAIVRFWVTVFILALLGAAALTDALPPGGRSRLDALSMHRDAPEYRPRWVPSQFVPISWKVHSNVLISEGKGMIVEQQWGSRRFSLLINADSLLLIEIGQFYFPGWQALLDGSVPLQINPAQRNGLIELSIPKGRHTLELQLTAQPPEYVGRVISAVSLLILSVLTYSWIRQKRAVKRVANGFQE